MRMCTVEGCESKLLAKGFCSKHYERVRKTGVTDLIKRKRIGHKTPCVCHPDRISHTKAGLCVTCYNRQVRRSNPDVYRCELQTEQQRARQRKYGLTHEEFETLLAKQNSVCAICSQPEKELLNDQPKPLNVDHDHITGKVRALLCSPCNKGIGQLKDSAELLRKAAAYLDKHK